MIAAAKGSVYTRTEWTWVPVHEETKTQRLRGTYTHAHTHTHPYPALYRQQCGDGEALLCSAQTRLAGEREHT